MIPKDWPMNVNEDYLARDTSDRNGLAKGDLVGFPQRGRGDRCLFCDQYDRCLSFAARKDWVGFLCRCCSYENKGHISFYVDEFESLIDEVEPEEEILFGDERQLDQLMNHGNNQENMLLTLIDKGLIDDDSH